MILNAYDENIWVWTVCQNCTKRKGTLLHKGKLNQFAWLGLCAGKRYLNPAKIFYGMLFVFLLHDIAIKSGLQVIAEALAVAEDV